MATMLQFIVSNFLVGVKSGVQLTSIVQGGQILGSGKSEVCGVCVCVCVCVCVSASEMSLLLIISQKYC